MLPITKSLPVKDLGLTTKTIAKSDDKLATMARVTTPSTSYLDAIFTMKLLYQGRDLLIPHIRSSSPLHTSQRVDDLLAIH